MIFREGGWGRWLVSREGGWGRWLAPKGGWVGEEVGLQGWVGGEVVASPKKLISFQQPCDSSAKKKNKSKSIFKVIDNFIAKFQSIYSYIRGRSV